MTRLAAALFAGALVASLAACSQEEASWAPCSADAPDSAAAQHKLDACAAIIRAGARGDALERALRLQGEAYSRLGDRAQALESLERAIALKRDDAGALVDRGALLLDEGELDRALADFNEAVRIDPANAWAYADRGILEDRRGAYDAAIADESQAIELRPDQPAGWVDRGFAYIGKREFEMALADFADALKLNAEDASAYVGRAAADRGKGEADAAIQDYAEAIKRQADDPDAHEGRAALLEARGDTDGAAKDYVAASDAYFQKREYGRAIALVNRALTLNPDDPEALNGRCWTRAVADTEIDAALADCKRSLVLRPDSAETLDSLGFAYFRLRRWDASVDSYDAALRQQPDLASSLFMRGVVKLRQGDQDGGQTDIAAAKASDANVVAQYAGYGVTP